jgi:serine protease Do
MASNGRRFNPGTRVGYFCVLFLAISSSVYAQDQLPDLVRRIKPSAVAIETFDARGEKLTRGSGFFIDKDRVVTNRHVIDGAYRAEVHLNSGNSFPVKSVLGVDAEGDVALLKVDAPANQVRPLSLDRTSPQEGESVVVIGNPLGLEGSVTNGIVSAVRDIPGFGRIIQITAPISPGSSGSPVVNMRGEVIGVATLQITGGQSVNFADPVGTNRSARSFHPDRCSTNVPGRIGGHHGSQQTRESCRSIFAQG